MPEKDTKLTENVDLANGHDARLARRALREGWITPEHRRRMAEISMDIAEDEGNDPRARNGAVANMLRADALAQADEHLARKEERIDDGKPTEGLNITVTRTNQLPDSDSA